MCEGVYTANFVHKISKGTLINELQVRVISSILKECYILLKHVLTLMVLCQYIEVNAQLIHA